MPSAAGWTFLTPSICHGPFRYSPGPIATFAGIHWFSGGRRHITSAKSHKGDISPEAMIAKATNGLEHWTQNSEQMERWQSIGMSDKEFADILKETICHKKTRAADVEAKLAINERRLNWLLERFNEEKAELGNTMWGAYNALTHYATHLPMSRESNTNREMVASRRNNEVRTVIDSPELALS